MPMSLKQEIRLLSMVDILGPLSDEELEDLPSASPTPFWSRTTPSTAPRRVGCNSTRLTKAGRRSPSLL